MKVDPIRPLSPLPRVKREDKPSAPPPAEKGCRFHIGSRVEVMPVGSFLKAAGIPPHVREGQKGEVVQVIHQDGVCDYEVKFADGRETLPEMRLKPATSSQGYRHSSGAHLTPLTSAGTTTVVRAWHGTFSKLPFERFERRADGTGAVSRGESYGGFFFAKDRRAAEYYSEYWLAQVEIKVVDDYPGEDGHPPTAMKAAADANAIYMLRDIVDGDTRSDIIVVPHSRVKDVRILKWVWSGNYSESDWWEQLDSIFGDGLEDDQEVTQEIIDGYIDATGGGLPYLLKQPEFAKYYKSKRPA